MALNLNHSIPTTHHEDPLDLLLWNVNGLVPKIADPDFVDLIKNMT